MIQPVILIVDPEPEVLLAIQDDLQRQYNDRLQVLRTNSDSAALEQLKTFKKNSEQNNFVTLFVVEQQNSQITAMEFLKIVIEMFPKAKQFLFKVHDVNDFTTRLPLSNAVII